MLVYLNIKDFALIKHTTLEPGPGLNILTGETGAGKTIVLDAVSLILGDRASTEWIRTGCEKAVLQGTFQLPTLNNAAAELLQKWGVTLEQDNNLLLTREISQGKSIARINEQVVTLSQLKALGRRLVDIHGQHEHQSLLHTTKHLQLLDAFGGEEVLNLKQKIKDLYHKLKQKQKELDELIEDPRERNRRLELLEYQKNEIEQAELSNQEETELFHLRKKLMHQEKLKEIVSYAYYNLYEGEDEFPSVVDLLGNIMEQLSEGTKLDSELKSYSDAVEQALIQIEETSRELNNYLQEIEANPTELQEVENRIDTYNELKRKYGGTVDEIHEYYQQVKSEIDYLQSTVEKRTELEKEKEKLSQEIIELAQKLSTQRNSLKQKLENKILSHLQDLGMEKVQFSISLTKCELSETGIDHAEFLFSPNAGEPTKPLAKIASGGEIARVMLALKSVFSQVDDIATLIFDEIDTGISGDAAQRVASKLKKLSNHTQVLCVTHLPQLASQADNHFKLTKEEINGRTETKAFVLSHEDRIKELAKMIDGEYPSNTSLKHAEKLMAEKR